MIYLKMLIIFTAVTIVVTVTYSLIKILEQYRIKTRRNKLVWEQMEEKNFSPTLAQSLFELNTEAFSRYLTYNVGHFSSILLNVYSIVFSIASLSMISLDISEDNTNEITRVISLLSTLFVIILVFARLSERSKRHFFAWKKCDRIILKVARILSGCTDVTIMTDNIYSILLLYNEDYYPCERRTKGELKLKRREELKFLEKELCNDMNLSGTLEKNQKESETTL